MAERTQQHPLARRLTGDDEEALRRFLRDMPEGDRTFFKEDLEDEESIARWCSAERGLRWVIAEGDDVKAMVSLIPGALWSSHVAELRMVVAAAHRRRGLGRKLARVGLAEALSLGFRKIIVEVAAEKEGDIEMFTSIGFTVEALLKDHICDRNGHLRDLVILAHDTGSVSGSLGALGLEAEFSGPATS
jgi:L-amino acid N-acyltransferase YncA